MDPAEYNLTSPDTKEEPIYENHERSNRGIDEYIEIVQKMSFTLFIIISLLGIIGNALVIWIAGFRMKKTISAVWFLHLAIADFLCCASLPLRIAEWVTIFQYQFLPAISFCISGIILFTINMSASVLLLTAMSIDRWVSVMWPFWAKVHRTRKLVRITAGMIWGMSLLMAGSVFYLHFYLISDVTEWCIIDSRFKDHGLKRIIDLSRLFIMFVIPFLIIFTSYVTVYIKLRNSKRPPRSQRPYRIITAVILCFFICWAPYYIWLVAPRYDGGIILFCIINTVVVTLASFNSCINPIIYVFMGQDFRHGFLRYIPFRLKEALSEHPDVPCREQEHKEPNPSTNV